MSEGERDQLQVAAGGLTAGPGGHARECLILSVLSLLSEHKCPCLGPSGWQDLASEEPVARAGQGIQCPGQALGRGPG